MVAITVCARLDDIKYTLPAVFVELTVSFILVFLFLLEVLQANGKVHRIDNYMIRETRYTILGHVVLHSKGGTVTRMRIEVTLCVHHSTLARRAWSPSPPPHLRSHRQLTHLAPT